MSEDSKVKNSLSKSPTVVFMKYFSDFENGLELSTLALSYFSKSEGDFDKRIAAAACAAIRTHQLNLKVRQKVTSYHDNLLENANFPVNGGLKEIILRDMETDVELDNLEESLNEQSALLKYRPPVIEHAESKLSSSPRINKSEVESLIAKDNVLTNGDSNVEREASQTFTNPSQTNAEEIDDYVNRTLNLLEVSKNLTDNEREIISNRANKNYLHLYNNLKQKSGTAIINRKAVAVARAINDTVGRQLKLSKRKYTDAVAKTLSVNAGTVYALALGSTLGLPKVKTITLENPINKRSTKRSYVRKGATVAQDVSVKASVKPKSNVSKKQDLPASKAPARVKKTTQNLESQKTATETPAVWSASKSKSETVVKPKKQKTPAVKKSTPRKKRKIAIPKVYSGEIPEISFDLALKLGKQLNIDLQDAQIEVIRNSAQDYFERYLAIPGNRLGRKPTKEATFLSRAFIEEVYDEHKVSLRTITEKAAAIFNVGVQSLYKEALAVVPSKYKKKGRSTGRKTEFSGKAVSCESLRSIKPCGTISKESMDTIFGPASDAISAMVRECPLDIAGYEFLYDAFYRNLETHAENLYYAQGKAIIEGGALNKETFLDREQSNFSNFVRVFDTLYRFEGELPDWDNISVSIAKKIGENEKFVKKVFYLLQEDGLISYKKTKDPVQKFLDIYYPVLTGHYEHAVTTSIKKCLEKTNERIKELEKIQYICSTKDCNYVADFSAAFDSEFACPDCADLGVKSMLKDASLAYCPEPECRRSAREGICPEHNLPYKHFDSYIEKIHLKKAKALLEAEL